MEDQDKPTSLPLNEFAIPVETLKKAGIPTAYAEIISRAGGTGGFQKFILREAHGTWNDPSISGQAWHGIRLWFAIKSLLFGIIVVRVLPGLLLGVFLLGGTISGFLALGFIASSNPATSSNTASATVPVLRGAIPEVSDLRDVYVGTKVKYVGANIAPDPGKVIARNLNVTRIEWQESGNIVDYSDEQLARAFKSGVIVITAI